MGIEVKIVKNIIKSNYKKYGFELKEEVKVPNTDLTLYAILRKVKNDVKENVNE